MIEPLPLGGLPAGLHDVILLADEERTCAIIENVDVMKDTSFTINEAHLTGVNARFRQRVSSILGVTSENIWTFRSQTERSNTSLGSIKPDVSDVVQLVSSQGYSRTVFDPIYGSVRNRCPPRRLLQQVSVALQKMKGDAAKSES
jgi:hypothetical protein